MFAVPLLCSVLYSKLPRYSTFYPLKSSGDAQFDILKKEDDWIQSKIQVLCA